MITIEDLTYNYPNTARPALRDVNLAVRPGEFVLLTGPSGAGKSTLLRTLNGLVPHFSGGRIAGRVRVAGRDPLRDGPRLMSQLVGMVFQNPEAQSVLDRVEAEIAFGLENAAVPSPEMRLRVAEVLDLLALTPLRQRSIASLSGGERQRVAIATALALRPQILVLDEPTSQLDPKSAEDLLHTLVRLNEDLGLTILLAEHRLERIVRYAERLVYLTDGAVALDGPVADYLAALPQLPPVATLGRALGWQPLPLTVKAARRLAPVRGVAASPVPTAVPDVPRPGHLPDAPLLQAEGVRFAYGRQPVLRGVDLAVRPEAFEGPVHASLGLPVVEVGDLEGQSTEGRGDQLQGDPPFRDGHYLDVLADPSEVFQCLWMRTPLVQAEEQDLMPFGQPFHQVIGPKLIPLLQGPGDPR